MKLEAVILGGQNSEMSWYAVEDDDHDDKCTFSNWLADGHDVLIIMLH